MRFTRDRFIFISVWMAFASNEMTQAGRSRNCTQGDSSFMLVQCPGTLAQTGPLRVPKASD